MVYREIINFCQKFYRQSEYPALESQLRIWSEKQPLAGKRILDATPLFTNTLLKYVPLIAAGADLTVATSDHVPYDGKLFSHLDQWGIRHVHNASDGEYHCILDCAGVHASITPLCGTAELTRSGFYRYENSPFPVIMVDDSRIKAIETCLGTGYGFLRGMREAGFTDFKDKPVVIFGLGKVGRGIAWYAANAGAKVTAVDEPDTRPMPGVTIVSRYDREAVLEAVRSAWCVVTVTGILDALKGNGAAQEILNGNQIVAAMGVENEWGDELPPERVLNNNAPLNFILDEPTRLRYIDPTMALSNAAALELCQNFYPAGVRKICPETEKYYWDIIEKQSLIADELKGIDI